MWRPVSLPSRQPWMSRFVVDGDRSFHCEEGHLAHSNKPTYIRCENLGRWPEYVSVPMEVTATVGVNYRQRQQSHLHLLFLSKDWQILSLSKALVGVCRHLQQPPLPDR